MTAIWRRFNFASTKKIKPDEQHERGNWNAPCENPPREQLRLKRGVAGFGSLLVLNGFIDFMAMDRHFAWSLDAQTDLVTADFNDDNSDVIVDYNAFVFFSRQY